MYLTDDREVFDSSEIQTYFRKSFTIVWVHGLLDDEPGCGDANINK